jgi:hypothetical protein
MVIWKYHIQLLMKLHQVTEAAYYRCTGCGGAAANTVSPFIFGESQRQSLVIGLLAAITGRLLILRIGQNTTQHNIG